MASLILCIVLTLAATVPVTVRAAEEVPPTDTYEEQIQELWQTSREGFEQFQEKNEEAQQAAVRSFEQRKEESQQRQSREMSLFILVFIIAVVASIVLSAWKWIRKMRVMKSIAQRTGRTPGFHEADILIAGAEGEADVDYRLKWWLKKHPECRLIPKDCTSKYSDACIRLRAPGGSESQEIDHILVSPMGVIHIETKNYGGVIDVTDTDTWRRKKTGKLLWDETESPAFQLQRHEQVIEEIVGSGVPVFGLICIANKDTQIRHSERSEYPIVKAAHLNRALDQMLKRAQESGRYCDAEILWDKLEAAKVGKAAGEAQR